MQSLAAFFVVQAVAHWLTIGPDHGQIHLGDDVGKDLSNRDRVRDDCLDAFGPSLIQKSNLGSFSLCRLSHV